MKLLLEVDKMELNRMIDHTLLKPEAQKEDILQIITEAKKYRFYSVCINPTWVALASEKLKGEPTAVCTVIGFPLGANTSETKALEAQKAIDDGADEEVQADIAAVVAVAKDRALVKVIIETCLLTKEEIVKACQLAKEAGADFVKTSTGFSTAGAKVEDVKLMRTTVGAKMGVKASGGIHSEKEALAMIDAGASRLGTSASIEIIGGSR